MYSVQILAIITVLLGLAGCGSAPEQKTRHASTTDPEMVLPEISDIKLYVARLSDTNTTYLKITGEFDANAILASYETCTKGICSKGAVASDAIALPDLPHGKFSTTARLCLLNSQGIATSNCGAEKRRTLTNNVNPQKGQIRSLLSRQKSLHTTLRNQAKDIITLSQAAQLSLDRCTEAIPGITLTEDQRQEVKALSKQSLHDLTRALASGAGIEAIIDPNTATDPNSNSKNSDDSNTLEEDLSDGILNSIEIASGVAGVVAEINLLLRWRDLTLPPQIEYQHVRRRLHYKNNGYFEFKDREKIFHYIFRDPITKAPLGGVGKPRVFDSPDEMKLALFGTKNVTFQELGSETGWYFTENGKISGKRLFLNRNIEGEIVIPDNFNTSFSSSLEETILHQRLYHIPASGGPQEVGNFDENLFDIRNTAVETEKDLAEHIYENSQGFMERKFGRGWHVFLMLASVVAIVLAGITVAKVIKNRSYRLFDNAGANIPCATAALNITKISTIFHNSRQPSHDLRSIKHKILLAI